MLQTLSNTPERGTELLRGSHRFRPYERLRSSDDYQRVKRVGLRRRTSHFGVNFASNGLPFHRLGMVVQKRFWNAVQRNRVKRLLREWFRTHKHQIPMPGKDIVIIGRPGAEALTMRGMEREFAAVFGKGNDSGS